MHKQDPYIKPFARCSQEHPSLHHALDRSVGLHCMGRRNPSASLLTLDVLKCMVTELPPQFKRRRWFCPHLRIEHIRDGLPNATTMRNLAYVAFLMSH
jgi:hypothetical protein